MMPIVVLGTRNGSLELNYNSNNNVLIIRKPGVNMGEEWSIELIR